MQRLKAVYWAGVRVTKPLGITAGVLLCGADALSNSPMHPDYNWKGKLIVTPIAVFYGFCHGWIWAMGWPVTVPLTLKFARDMWKEHREDKERRRKREERWRKHRAQETQNASTASDV